MVFLQMQFYQIVVSNIISVGSVDESSPALLTRQTQFKPRSVEHQNEMNDNSVVV
ncbi:hypothetical protein DOY81_002499, partial [Sarcophaga bullata]